MLLADLEVQSATIQAETRRAPADAKRRSESARPRAAEPRFDKPSVAALSPQEIGALSTERLVEAVRCAQLPFIESDAGERLMYLDRPTLEQLVYLARRACRNQGY